MQNVKTELITTENLTEMDFLELTEEAEKTTKLTKGYQELKVKMKKKKKHCKTYADGKQYDEMLSVIDKKILTCKIKSKRIGQEIRQRMASYYPYCEIYADELIKHYADNLSFKEITDKPTCKYDNKHLHQSIKRLVLATQVKELIDHMEDFGGNSTNII